jgi:hypothetical protein
VAVLAVVAAAGVTASGADFTTAAASPGNSFSAAADFNTVAVAVTDPGAALHGTVTLQSTATSERGIASVRYQTSVAGANTWGDACLATTAPFACDWNSAGVADGMRDVRVPSTRPATSGPPPPWRRAASTTRCPRSRSAIPART